VPLYFCLCLCQMLTNFKNSFTIRLNSKFCNKQTIKYPTTPQMRRYTTLRNVCARKWPCSRGEWSKLSCKTQSFETVAEKYSSNDVSTILLTDEKIFAVVTLKNLKNRQLYATAATKKKDVRTKRLRTQSAFRQSLMALVGESQVVEKTPI